MSIWQQLVEVFRRLPGFYFGAPWRWMLRMHSDPQYIDGAPYCLSLMHRRPVMWPCREYMDAVEALHEHPEYRSSR